MTHAPDHPAGTQPPRQPAPVADPFTVQPALDARQTQAAHAVPQPPAHADPVDPPALDEGAEVAPYPASSDAEVRLAWFRRDLPARVPPVTGEAGRHRKRPRLTGRRLATSYATLAALIGGSLVGETAVVRRLLNPASVEGLPATVPTLLPTVSPADVQAVEAAADAFTLPTATALVPTPAPTPVPTSKAASKAAAVPTSKVAPTAAPTSKVTARKVAPAVVPKPAAKPAPAKPTSAKVAPKVETIAATGALGGRIVAAARGWFGTPYRYGGTTRSGIDCSGLVLNVLKAVGVSGVPRTSGAQAAWATPISASQARPGDLVFFGSPVHHVGIYIGNNQMIDAATDGIPVQVHTLYKETHRFGRVPA